MPTLNDVIVRRVEIRGSAPGVDDAASSLDRLKASIAAANDNLVKANASAKANSDGWRITGEGAVSAANHLRQAAEAAYVFSPAFRNVVNSLAAPALKGAAVALEAVATGIVAATNVAGTGVIRLGTAVETTFPALALLGVNLKAAGTWMEAFSPTLAGVGSTILSKLLPALSLLGKGLLIVDAVRLVAQAWQLGGERLAEYVALSEKAAAAGVSTDFFQRITKAAEDAKTPVDALTDAFKNLTAAATPTLGGTVAQNRLSDLVKAGNFSANSGVGELKSANSTEERLRALRDLVGQALDKGERLAALDIAKAFGGDKIAANLAKDSDYLNKMITAADEIARKELIPDSAVNNATELQNRLDAAEKILSQRWHPIQDLLTQLGIKMREVWVGIVEAIAKAVDAIFTLGQRIAGMLAPLMSFIQSAGQLIGKAAPYLALAPGGLGIPAAAGAASIGFLSSPSPTVTDDARSRLASGLRNPNVVASARDYTNSVYDAVRKDTSFDPNAVKPLEEAWKRATDAVNKYIQTTLAEAATVSKSAAEQEKAKVVAQLTAAAIKDGTPITAGMRAEMEKLGNAAGTAAQALEKARVAGDIKFNRDTSLLSQEDVQIAQTLNKIYPDVATALGSVEAAAMRANGSLKPCNDNRPAEEKKSDERDQRPAAA